MAAGNLFVFPRVVLRHVTGEHQVLGIQVRLRAARKANSKSLQRNKLLGEWQRWVGGVFAPGKLVWLGGGVQGNVVVECVAQGKLGAPKNDLPHVGRRIKTRQLVGQTINIGGIAEFPADILGVVEQKQLRVGGKDRGAKKNQRRRGQFLKEGHIGKSVCVDGLLSSEILMRLSCHENS